MTMNGFIVSLNLYITLMLRSILHIDQQSLTLVRNQCNWYEAFSFSAEIKLSLKEKGQYDRLQTAWARQKKWYAIHLGIFFSVKNPCTNSSFCKWY